MRGLTNSYPSIFLLLAFFATACTVTNGLYVHDPLYTAKKEFKMYGGGGTGIRADIESVDDFGNIEFSNQLKMAPNLYFGGQYGLFNKFDLRFSVHFPFAVGGIGFRGGVEYSFLNDESWFNLAIGGDFGGVVAKDSIRILGSSSPLDVEVNGAINTDLFIPLTFSINENVRIILTPRYSFHTFYIRENVNRAATFKFKPSVPILALGVRAHRVYIEVSAFEYDGRYFPNFGLAFTFNDKRITEPLE